MLPLFSDNIILAVAHVRSSLNRTLDALDRINLTKDDLVFIEPKRSIVLGENPCEDPSIEHFFNKVMESIRFRQAMVVPLNPSLVPSHKSTHMYHKYARQLAEEEHMASVVSQLKPRGRKVIIIGNLHAKRLCRLLNDKSEDFRLVNACPTIPDDIVGESWRECIETGRGEAISTDWTKEINRRILSMCGLEHLDNNAVKEILWNDVVFLDNYSKLAKILTKEVRPEEFKFRFDDEFLAVCKEISSVTREVIDRYNQTDAHDALVHPYVAIE